MLCTAVCGSHLIHLARLAGGHVAMVIEAYWNPKIGTSYRWIGLRENLLDTICWPFKWLNVRGSCECSISIHIIQFCFWKFEVWTPNTGWKVMLQNLQAFSVVPCSCSPCMSIEKSQFGHTIYVGNFRGLLACSCEHISKWCGTRLPGGREVYLLDPNLGPPNWTQNQHLSHSSV